MRNERCVLRVQTFICIEYFDLIRREKNKLRRVKMCSQDSFGLIGYNFEPEYSAEELEEIESIATGRNGENTVEDDFCTCLNCAIMSSTRENVCCRESELVLPNFTIA